MTLTDRGIAFLATGTLALAVALATGTLLPGAFGLLLLAALAHAHLRARLPRVLATRIASTDLTREGIDVDVTLTLEAETRIGASALTLTDTLPPGLVVAEGAATARLATETRRQEIRYRVRGQIPGRFRIGPVRISATDPLSLVHHETTTGEATPLVVYPRVEDVKNIPVSSRLSRALSGDHLVGMAGQGASFFALREYQDGDTLRDVNWKASARNNGDLVVNQREKESHAGVHFLVDGRLHAATGTLGMNARLLAIRAVATLATAGFRRRDQSRITLYGPDAPRSFGASATDPNQAGLIDPLLDATPEGTRTLRNAVDHIVPELRPKSPVILVSSLLDDPDAEQAVFALRALDATVVAVIPQAHVLLGLSGATNEEVATAERRHKELVARLRAQGCRVVDWTPGEALSLALMKEALVSAA